MGTLETGVGGAIGGMIGGPPGAAVGAGVGMGMGVLGHPKVAGKAALGMNKLKDKAAIDLILQNNPGISAAELAAILSGRLTEEDQSLVR